MTITATITQVTGPAGAAGTVLATQAVAAPANWTRLTGLSGFVPAGGAKLNISSDAEAFRFEIVDPVSSGDTAAADRTPRTNGVLVPWYGTGADDEDALALGSQVWVKQA